MESGNSFRKIIRVEHGRNLRGRRKFVWLIFLYLLIPVAIFASPTAAAYSITDFVTCENANASAARDWHVPKADFRTTDDNFFVWAELRDVSGIHPVEMKLYRPDGDFYGQETQMIIETNRVASWWRMAARWTIRGGGIERIPGEWRLDLVVDGAVQRSLVFRINLGTLEPADAGPIGFEESDGVPNPSSPNQPARAWMVETSVDLKHWTTIQTNVLSAIGYQTPTADEKFRVTLKDIRSCILEASTDSVNWIPIQTNDLPAVDGDSTGRTTARFYRAAIQ